MQPRSYQRDEAILELLQLLLQLSVLGHGAAGGHSVTLHLPGQLAVIHRLWEDHTVSLRMSPWSRGLNSVEQSLRLEGDGRSFVPRSSAKSDDKWRYRP